MIVYFLLQFFDDVEYLLDGLKGTRSIATRCLSALDFASHCSQPSFRVSLRAHGIAPKIFSALQDAPSDKVGFCVSTSMYFFHCHTIYQ